MNYERKAFDKVLRLADHVAATWDPAMKWMWGEALLGYALDELDKANGSNRYTDFLAAYCDHWAAADPEVNQSDTAAPGLITYAMYKRTGNPDYKRLTDKVLDYIRNEPRLYLDCLNHLGCSKKSWIYPKSIWVDSVMMFSVFTSLYARENGDTELLDFAARQPEQYASMMLDRQKDLWIHSYWVGSGKAYPQGLYWGRGNGWVVCGFPWILDNIGIDHPKAQGVLDLLGRTSRALLPLQSADGTFNTLLDQPSYRELSATALISAGWMHSVARGYLDECFLEPAVKAFMACIDAVEENGTGVFMPEISGPTIPLPLLPKLGYEMIPRGKNWSYGIAALIFAANAYRELHEAGKL